MLISKVLERARRMGNPLDVARARSGPGLPVVRAAMNMGLVARQVIDEVRTAHPRRAIELATSGGLVGQWNKARSGGCPRTCPAARSSTGSRARRSGSGSSARPGR